jgi:broad specificity phosphatase PhoE
VLVLVRHGRTAANASGLLQGRSNLPLDEIGRRQAACIGAALQQVDRVISSPLTRAVETASALGRPIEIDERWIELDYGEFEGVRPRDIPEETWQRLRDDPDFVPAGGESLRSLYDRVVPSCEELLVAARDATIVVVSHVSPMKAALAWVLALPPTASFRCFLDQAAIMRIDATARGPILRTYNETWHLTS